MPSEREAFWTHSTYAIVGNSSRRKFPLLTYRALKKSDKTVYPVDPSSGNVDGDKAYPELKYLPAVPDGVILEVPKDETAQWVRTAAEAGIKNVWIHQQTETPEALAAAKDAGMNVCYGTCAVMYNVPGFSAHAFHRWVMKLGKKY
jgi:predicted CoA-binding protein